MRVKGFKCVFCNRIGTRRDIRKCIMTHIKGDKKFRKQSGESRKNSNITAKLKEIEW